MTGKIRQIQEVPCRMCPNAG